MLDPFTDVHPSLNSCTTSQKNPFHPHMRPIEAKKAFEIKGWDFKVYRKFTCVRHPWARLVSLYDHICRGIEAPPDFNSWIYSISTSGDGGGGPPWQNWRRYGTWDIDNFIADETGKRMDVEVVRLEDFREAIPSLFAKLGIPNARDVEILHKNKAGDALRYNAYYDVDSISHIERLYGKEIKEFGYRYK